MCRREELNDNLLCLQSSNIPLFYQVGSSVCNTSCQHVQVITFLFNVDLCCGPVCVLFHKQFWASKRSDHTRQSTMDGWSVSIHTRSIWMQNTSGHGIVVFIPYVSEPWQINNIFMKKKIFGSTGIFRYQERSCSLWWKRS